MDQKKIGEYIHRYRKEKGLTQQQLAEILHVSNKAVSKWETGVNTPDTSMLIPLSEALGVSVLDLLMGSDLDKADTSEINSFGTRLSESLTLIKNKYKIAITVLLFVILMICSWYIYQRVIDNNYISRFSSIEKGDTMEEVINKLGSDMKPVKSNNQLNYITPSGNLVVIEFFNNEGLTYSYVYQKDSNKVINALVPPFNGEYRLKDDGRIKIVFDKGRYEINGSGSEYNNFIGQLSSTSGEFSNEIVPDQYSYGFVREFYLDQDNHDVIIMYLGNKDFKVRMGIHTYDFHKYE